MGADLKELFMIILCDHGNDYESDLGVQAIVIIIRVLSFISFCLFSCLSATINGFYVIYPHLMLLF